MAINRITTEASPETVFAILADPSCYAEWVVGSSELRRADENWPHEGATFHHTQFLPRVGLKDTTSVLECEPPHRIRLCVRARPLVIAEVELRLRASREGGAEIEMMEEPVGAFVGKFDNPLFQWSLKLRNTESLRRLKKLAEERQPSAPVS